MPPVQWPPHIHKKWGAVPDGVTIDFQIDVTFTVDVKVECSKCGKKKTTTRPFTFSRTIEVPYTIKGIKLITKIIGMSVPGLQVLAWGHTILEIYGKISDAKDAIDNIKSGWDTSQALRQCHLSKRALLSNSTDDDEEDGGDQEMEIPLQVAEEVAAKLKLPDNWQALYGKVLPDPPGLCPIYARPDELRGKFCLCHNSKGKKQLANCSIFDKLPAKVRDNIVWSNAKCLPVNCEPIKPNRTIVAVGVTASLDDVSDESLESFMGQIESQVGGAEHVGVVAVAQGNGTSSGTTELQVQVNEPQVHSLASVHSLSAPDGRIFPVNIADRSESRPLKWFYIVLAGVVVAALLMLIVVVAFFFKGLMNEKNEKEHEGYNRA
jgi:hypothetical protein